MTSITPLSWGRPFIAYNKSIHVEKVGVVVVVAAVGRARDMRGRHADYYPPAPRLHTAVLDMGYGVGFETPRVSQMLLYGVVWDFGLGSTRRCPWGPVGKREVRPSGDNGSVAFK